MGEVGDAIDEARAAGAEAAADVLPDKCSIKRPSPASNDQRGQFDETPAPVHAGVPFDYEALSVSEIVNAGSVGATASHKLIFAADADVQAQDTVIGSSGITFQVVGRLDRRKKTWLWVLATKQG